ncbi:hypothetical protein ACFX13_028758 [Malus domestica]
MFGLQHILKRVVDHPICLLQRLLKKIKQYGNGSSGFRGDVLSKVFGAERHGRARGVGGGVPPTKLGIFSQQKLRNHQMDEKVHNLTNQVRALTELVHLFMKNQDFEERNMGFDGSAMFESERD